MVCGALLAVITGNGSTYTVSLKIVPAHGPTEGVITKTILPLVLPGLTGVKDGMLVTPELGNEVIPPVEVAVQL